VTIREDLECKSNEDFGVQVTWQVDGEDVTLTSGQLHVRRRKADADPLIDLEADLDGGTASFLLPAAEVADLNWPHLDGQTGVYDAVIVSELGQQRLIEGEVTFSWGVTRPDD
jgi:hypothetical protein